jgi:ADP-heptose:LPS heptosyltransferase
MWTGVAREIWKRTGIKSLPIESHGPTIKMVHSPIFYNNPYVIQPQEKFETVFPLILNNPATNYCKEDTPERAIHRYDKHIISQVCEAYGILDPEVRCDIFFTDDEKIFLDEFRSQISASSYVTIEPFTKDEYTVNKSYPFEKWQIVANELAKHTAVIQIGQKTNRHLDNCINMTGTTTFREAAAIISESSLFIGSEGGLMHAANSVGVKSVILITGFIHPAMTCYPENENIWIGKNHGPCGMKIECIDCKEEASTHDPLEIVNASIRRISN